MITDSLYAERTSGLVSGKCRMVILLTVIGVHVLLISLPWLLSMRQPAAKENMFKVKLGGDTPSVDLNVGKPERTRPTGAEPSSSGKVTPAPEPTVKPPPKKITPAPEPTVKPPPRKITPAPEPTVKPSTTKPTRGADGRTSSSRQTDTGRRGGSNFNNTVPIGSRNVGQRYGQPNNGTPQGGWNAEEEAYHRRLKSFVDIKFRSVEPPAVLLGDQRPQVTIELRIAADGRVVGSRIVELSKNSAMDESIRRLLKNLDRVPIPPNGATTILFEIQAKGRDSRM